MTMTMTVMNLHHIHIHIYTGHAECVDQQKADMMMMVRLTSQRCVRGGRSALPNHNTIFGSNTQCSTAEQMCVWIPQARIFGVLAIPTLTDALSSRWPGSSQSLDVKQQQRHVSVVDFATPHHLMTRHTVLL
ncbi:hypothetical protein LZ554_008513 [Drepanopeziza brunnea f. sp. 'monogermtubi']|nr:hypothetical protein LZ554_008513 [Drepanopeziza brunnea f. sp. 'monogermtubi']